MSGSNTGDTQCVDVSIINDDCKEKNESFILAICALGDASVHILEFFTHVYIVDDEGESVSNE